jgi:NAD(P)-dependent dehydrogenase (short-subunit alcohol dehydrogenase family)
MSSLRRSSNLFDLSGKVALVTGATRGIGLAIAEEMARQGAAVAVSSNEEQACVSIAMELRDAGFEAIGIPCDVSSRPQIEQLVARTVEAFKRIDIVVCNAGVAPHMGPIATATDADWDQTMSVNLRSALWLTNLVIPGMAERRDGAVVIVSSIAGLRGNKGIGLYGLSKAASAQLVRNLAVEWLKQLRRRVADADDAGIGVLCDRLCDEPGGVRETHDPCLRAESFYEPRYVQPVSPMLRRGRRV